MSTNWYLHDPLFAESRHIGKTYAHDGIRLGWDTRVYPGSQGSGEWSDAETLVKFLHVLHEKSVLIEDSMADGRMTVYCVAWVCSEYGEIVRPGEMADRILACVIGESIATEFS